MLLVALAAAGCSNSVASAALDASWPSASLPGSAASAAAPSRAALAAPATPGRRVPDAESGVRWSALTPAQREALAPLERDWSSIDADRKQKWLVMAERFRSLAPADRQRIQARMSEWAKLSPAERGQARLRFQEANRIDASERRQRWIDYQALSPEQKRRLAAQAAAESTPSDGVARRRAGGTGALHAVREGPQSKSNMVPNPALSAQPKAVAPTVVRAGPGATTTLISRPPAPPPHQQTGMPKIAATPEFVDRSTLLPRRGPQAAAIGSPATPAAPVERAR